ncbi:pyridoxamine 5'-phosphate oxidase family protein [Myxococcota bacterium]|nr:pyridoxamine 5'-phosphate oxidase family protein [Myxococcota bacterium]MCZ7617586.1 pyridoxamine 5'-phosphate oxidase family protein [Myxococcota bacterium]
MKHTGPWSRARIDAHLERTVIPVRLACATQAGHPHVLSLWYLWRDGAVWCASGADAQVIRWLRAEPRCGFEVARDDPPYHGVRGRGHASLDPARGPELLGELVDRYLGTRASGFARWLLSRADDEIAIRITPQRLLSWDFTERMSGP